MIIPINAASDGYLSDGINTLSIASNGYLFNIIIEEITTTIPSGIVGSYIHKKRRGYVGGKSQGERRTSYTDEDDILKKNIKKLPEKVTKITVTCTVDGKDLVKTKTVKKVGVKLSNIKVEMDKQNKIKIKVVV